MRISKTLLKTFLSTSLGDAFFTLKKNGLFEGNEIPYRIKNTFSKEQIDEMTNMSIINEGIKIGSLAKDYWRNWAKLNNYEVLDMPEFEIESGEFKNYNDYIEHCKKLTNEVINGNVDTVIFEAAFEYKYKNFDNTTQIRTDILTYNSKSKNVDLYEVKAVNSPKGEHYYDVLFQQYILTKIGISINSSNIQYLNKEYKRNNEINLEELFKIEDSLYLSNFSRPIVDYSEKNGRMIVNYSNSVATRDEWPTYVMQLKNGGTRKRSKLYHELLEFKTQYMNLDPSLSKEDKIDMAFKPFTLKELSLFYYERFEYLMPILNSISKMFPEGSELLEIVKAMDENPDIKNRQPSALFNDEIKRVYKEAFWYISESASVEQLERQYLPVDKNDPDLINKIVEFIKNEQEQQDKLQKELLSKKFNPNKKEQLGIIENLYRARATQKSEIRYILDKNYLNELEETVTSVGNSNFQNTQRTQISSHKNWNLIKDKYRIGRVLSKYKTPIYMVDFETVASATPVIDNATPYQQVPFQFSLHVITDEDITSLNEKGSFDRSKIYHSEYLADSKDKNFSDTFAKKLFDELTKFGPGTFVAYNKAFEKTVMKKLIENNNLTEHQENFFELVIATMEDLMDFFKFKDSDQNKSEIIYYDPRMNGSFSIKKTLPVIDNTFSYKTDLEEIHNGSEALDAFKRRMNNLINDEDWKKTAKNLLKYCEQDTWSMIKIFEYFYNLINGEKDD